MIQMFKIELSIRGRIKIIQKGSKIDHMYFF